MARPLQWSRNPALALILALVMAASQVTAARAQGISLIRDAEIETFVREMSDPIFEVAGLEPKNVELLLVNDKSLNAFVAGGQNLFIHTGLLQRVENSGQLAGVIAHETGHIAGGHLARLPDAFKTARVAMILSTILGAAALAAGAGDAGIAILQGGQHVAQRSLLAYSRAQESAADQAGLRYLESIGWSAKGFTEFMAILAEQEVLSAARQDPYVRTHPLTTERVATLRASLFTRLAALQQRLPIIREVRGRGFMVGIELTIDGRPIVAAARAQRLLINCTQERVLRLLPAMTITKTQLDRGLSILEDVLVSHAKSAARV